MLVRRGKNLSAYKQGVIMVLREDDKSINYNTIVAGRSKLTIWEFLNNQECYQRCNYKGRPQKTTARQKRQIIHMASTGKMSCEDIRKELDYKISRPTIYCILKDSQVLDYCKQMPASFMKRHHKSEQV